ncbi:MAG TPA: crossover junction endodeoxyribonuclease RuvC [Phycisphaerae bacterium]|nr:crossover junction endodeoxyribonuclease RuvC [Phycisphaerae bacterium]HOJ75971.1 crossover junction endodeoxyribonuclease RuvC [Phycisphaerae bacterium]HOM53353.1 crossover junction endodeoxyribonuclease RuvC [Phycisphaerae bacterium]HON66669.1 crossover junction endodeoxyribonuclease RuvC [Phycisphaerae bacterium]HOQ84440.1 crossover junction endodeoxyribonuclease RuvC [Phycisphaerae bacterium]
MARKSTIICGFDPGLRVTGYGIIRVDHDYDFELLEAGVLRADVNAPLARRLYELAGGAAEVLKEYKVNAVAVEQIYSHYQRPRTAILMAHARGVILLEAARQGIDVLHLPATTIKKHVTGNGRATKEQMQRAVAQALSLAEMPEPPDVADALAIAMCASVVLRRPAKVALNANDDLLTT